VTIVASFNSTSDWIGIPILLIALGLLWANDLKAFGPGWSRGFKVTEIGLIGAAVAIIGWRFIVMT
jgi:hypothetical protein